MDDSDGVTVFIFESNNRHTVIFINIVKEQNTLITVLASSVFWGQNTNFRVPLRPSERNDTSMNRTKEIKIRFTDDELLLLNAYVSKAGFISREKYMRTVLLKSVPREQPSINYQKLINEFNAIGNNLNQLVKLAYYQPLIEQETLSLLAQLKALITTTEVAVRGVS